MSAACRPAAVLSPLAANTVWRRCCGGQINIMTARYTQETYWRDCRHRTSVNLRVCERLQLVKSMWHFCKVWLCWNKLRCGSFPGQWWCSGCKHSDPFSESHNLAHHFRVMMKSDRVKLTDTVMSPNLYSSGEGRQRRQTAGFRALGNDHTNCFHHFFS